MDGLTGLTTGEPVDLSLVESVASIPSQPEREQHSDV